MYSVGPARVTSDDRDEDQLLTRRRTYQSIPAELHTYKKKLARLLEALRRGRRKLLNGILGLGQHTPLGHLVQFLCLEGDKYAVEEVE
jgi:hypothetical protein